MAEKKFFWLKLKENFFSDKAIKKLRKMAGGDTYTIIYLKMLLLGLRNNGKIYYDGVEDTFHEEIALELDEEPDNVQICMLFLEKNGLLEKVSEYEAFLTETPSMTISESASAARMRRLRTRKASQCDAPVTPELRQCDKSVTTEIDIDTDIELEKEIEILNNAQSCETTSAPKEKEPAVYELPCVKNQVYPVTQSQIDSWLEDYPNVDVIQALRNMRAWLRSNPSKKKTVNGCARFINHWLANDQNSGKNPRKPEEQSGDWEQDWMQEFEAMKEELG